MYKVLLIDDEIYMLDLMKETINWHEFNMVVTDTAANGYMGYNKFIMGDFDIVITDIKMPVMSGMEMAKKIRENNPDVIIIFISSYEEFEYAKKAIHINAAGYILKPIDNDDLESTLRAVSKRLDNKNKVISGDNEIVLIENDDDEQANNVLVIDEIKKYIADNLRNKLNLKDVAEMFFYSPNYLGKLFKKEMGMSFNDYVISVRMEKATQLLKMPQCQINDISSILGYSNSSYFTKQFREYYGVAPKEYRNLNR